MKKILFVISSLKSGGAERVLANMTMHMPKDIEIDILLNNTENIAFPYRGNLISMGIKIPGDGTKILYHMSLLFKRTYRVYKLKKSQQYLACISFMDSSNFANILSGNKYCKSIVSIHTNLLDKNISWKYKVIVKPIVKILYNFASKVVVVSEEIAKGIVEKLKIKEEKIAVIHNGYDTKDISIRSNEDLEEAYLKLVENKKIIITAGRLCREKGQWHLIRAMKELVKNNSNSVLVILGEGEYRTYLQGLIHKNNLENHVFLLGNKENPYKYVKHADVFVLSSIVEGFPNVLAEALCLGVPCVATDFHSGARELLAPEISCKDKVVQKEYHGSYGIITPCCSGKQYIEDEPLEQSEIELANTIRKVIEDDNINSYFRTKSLEKSKELGIENAIEKWLALIK